MARRRKPSAPVLLGYVCFFTFMFLLSACLFKLVKTRIESFKSGYEIARLEREEQELKEEIRGLALERARLESVYHLLQMNQAMNLYLLPPHEWMEFEPLRKTNTK